ncbi:acyltransferase [Brevibacillus laterosporus]|uniref:acyltransferase n=1 Tax=Brevibacillus laterosporus TaxID=1465 RepID=UPI0024065146|nr:acyltransferase [Brevibacillus laterosporus]MDF9413185.1 acyltransferase [Brevibacillus laterosporus]
MENRLREYDFIRVLCVLGVIAIHVTSHFVTRTDFAFIWNQLSRFAVPMFMLLSGFFLFYQDRKLQLHQRPSMKKRMKRLIIPYLLWTIIYALYTQSGLLHNQNYVMWIDYLFKSLWQGKGYVHLYFMLIVFQFYLLYPWLRSWYYRSPNSMLFVSFILTVGIQSLIYLSQHDKVGFLLPKLWWSYSIPIPIWIFFFTAGMFLAQCREQWENWLKRKTLWLLLAWALTFGLVVMDTIWSRTYTLSIKPSIILYCFICFFLFYHMGRLFYQKKNPLHSIFNWISEQSFLIFLLHPLLLSYLSSLAVTNKLEFMWKGNLGIVNQYLITVIVTLLITYLLSRFSWIHFLGGVPPKRRAKGIAANVTHTPNQTT